jgi:hypothetical protein
MQAGRRCDEADLERCGMQRRELLAALSGSLLCPEALAQAAPADVPAGFGPERGAGGLPAGWQQQALSSRKKLTDYRLTQEGGSQVLHARARDAASMLLCDRVPDLKAFPRVRWQWKLGRLPTQADNAVASREDSAARLIFMFDGDRSQLSLRDRTVMRMAKTLSGQEMPFATLMWVSSAVAPVGTLVSNSYTRRVQMLVAARAQDGLGRWQSFERDLVQDYRRAFGQAPGRLIAYGVMSDSDNTRSEAETWYSNIRFLPPT